MARDPSSPACAACRCLRRKCIPSCPFAPYFPATQPQKFASVHKIFGVANITKMLTELPEEQREDAVNSLAYEAEARVKDPVYGCVGPISVLHHEVLELRAQLSALEEELLHCKAQLKMHQSLQPHDAMTAGQQSAWAQLALVQASGQQSLAQALSAAGGQTLQTASQCARPKTPTLTAGNTMSYRGPDYIAMSAGGTKSTTGLGLSF